MNKPDQTSFIFREYNCAQTIFSLFSGELGMKKGLALKIASGFGSGMNCGETCGAVTGAYMVIGLKHGHASSVPEEKLRTSALVNRFNSLFLEKHASLKCKELLGYDISDPADKQKAREAGVFQTRCPEFLKTAATILENNF